jgi:hypothetical protein
MTYHASLVQSRAASDKYGICPRPALGLFETDLRLVLDLSAAAREAS